jgi:hypothetical protein
MRKIMFGAMVAGVLSLGAAQLASAEGVIPPRVQAFFPGQPISRLPASGQFGQPYGRQGRPVQTDGRGRTLPQPAYPGTYGYPQQRPTDGDDQGGYAQGGYQTQGRQAQRPTDSDDQGSYAQGGYQTQGRQAQGRQTGRNTRAPQRQRNHGRG